MLVLRPMALGKATQRDSRTAKTMSIDGSCPALRFPRTLTQVLPDAADRHHLRRIYFERVRHKSTLTYYNLLQQLATDRRDRRLRRILRDVERRAPPSNNK